MCSHSCGTSTKLLCLCIQHENSSTVSHKTLHLKILQTESIFYHFNSHFDQTTLTTSVPEHPQACTSLTVSTCVISITFVCNAVDRTRRKQTVCSTGFAEMQTHHTCMYFITSYNQTTVLNYFINQL